MHVSWPRFWVDHSKGFNYNLVGNSGEHRTEWIWSGDLTIAQTWQERRNLVLSSVEKAGFGWWIVLVAGIGFLTDAYDIFSINTVVPMLSIIYWEGEFPTQYQLGLNTATLLGSMIGQVAFGLLADKYGRRKMYGLELIVTITASLGLATSSTGINGSMSIMALLIFWRLVMGVGIGADYPLSAVITAEFAPTKYRARMLAAVFICQPLGQLIAVLMAFAATAGFKSYVAHATNAGACSVNAIDPAGLECARTIDRAWRLVAGLGAVPAAIAIVFRLTIPESVYYSLDIKNDSNEAMHAKEYFSNEDLPTTNMVHLMQVEEYEMFSKDGHGLGISRPSSQRSPEVPQTSSLHQPEPAFRHDHHWQHVSEVANVETGGAIVEALEDPHPAQASRADFYKYMISDGNWTDLFATSGGWMLLDFTFYLLGVNSSSFVPTMFGEKTGPQFSPYGRLINNERHILESTSIGALCGSSIAICVMHYYSRKKIQTGSFLVLGGLFIIVGSLYVTLPSTNAHAILVIFYGVCQLFYNFGPNTTTFIIPAEAFPTRYRCTCYGISAACGKLGSVLGQVLVTKVTNNTRLGVTLITFVIVMLAGAWLSKSLTPETCDINGKSRKLEELAKGKGNRKLLELEEREADGKRN